MKLLLLIPLLLLGCSPPDPAMAEKHSWQNWGAVTDINGKSYRQFRHCETCNAAQARTVRY